MKLPIYAYGSVVLRKQTEEIDKNFEGLNELIADMYETMYDAGGVGLAAPQIGKSIRLFVIDTGPFEEEDEAIQVKQVFINPEIIEEEGEEWEFNEGCLSIPEIREDVSRKPKITIEYFDENFNTHTERFDGLVARVIQHEFDHLEGILFTDYLRPLKMRLLKKRLDAIKSGKIQVDYAMKFPLLKKGRR